MDGRVDLSGKVFISTVAAETWQAIVLKSVGEWGREGFVGDEPIPDEMVTLDPCGDMSIYCKVPGVLGGERTYREIVLLLDPRHWTWRAKGESQN